MKTDFVIVPDEERPEPTRSQRGPSDLSLALETGVTVFAPGLRRSFPASSYLRKKGFKVHAVRGSRHVGGKPTSGFYYWVE